MPLYTKKGDEGETGLPGGRRFSKSETIFEVLGVLDEVNAQIGLAKSLINNKEILGSDYRLLSKIQTTLLSIGACLAMKEPHKATFLKQLDRLTLELERQIDAWEKQLPNLQNFILPGGSQAAAMLHLARTTCRRLERNFHKLEERKDLKPISRYFNRLSDFFFQAARWQNFRNKENEEIWQQST